MAERAFIQSMLDIADARRDAVIKGLRTDVDRLRDAWADGYAEQRQASEERIAAIRAETQRYLRSVAADDTEPAPELARQAPQGASAPGNHPVSPGAPGSAGQPTSDPRAAELAELAEADFKSMSMAEYAHVRQHLIRADSGMF